MTGYNGGGVGYKGLEDDMRRRIGFTLIIVSVIMAVVACQPDNWWEDHWWPDHDNDPTVVSDYDVDENGKVWELVYDSSTGSITRHDTGWYAATSDNAQKVLDAVASGENVYFTAGTYSDDYYIRPSRATAEIYTRDPLDSQSIVLNEKIPIEELGNDAFYHYLRNLENVEFRADKNAVFTGSFQFLNSDSGDGIYKEYDAVRETSKVIVGYINHIRVNNLTFNGFVFKKSGIESGSCIYANYDYQDSEDKDSLDNLIFSNCSFIGDTLDENSNANAPRGIRLMADSETAFKNLVIENCTFDTLYQGLYIQHVAGIDIENNVFTNIQHNSIALQSDENKSAPDTKYTTGDILITGNTFDAVIDTPIGRGGFKNASITINDNNFINMDQNGAHEGIMVKLGNGGNQKLIDTGIRFTENRFNGNGMEFVVIEQGNYNKVTIDFDGNITATR